MSFLWSFGAKKDASTPSAVPAAPTQPAFKAMSNAFRKGVQYNMKIVLRGDVMTGKSNLFYRLQGSEFVEDYSSTPQIQVANIPWHYKDSNDIVKIEVWDVVDKAHNKNKSTESKGIKLEHKTSETDVVSPPPPPSPPTAETEQSVDVSMGLDATTVNVYRNTHGAILLFDTTKPWTFDYVNKELKNVPETMAVLVLGNFCDKVQDRKVELDTIHATLYEHNQERIKKGAIKPNLIRYVETSMQSGQGLKYIYEYLGVPFLQLMIESLNKQLELKAVEIVDLLETLDTEDDVPEGMQRRRGQDNFNQRNIASEPRLARQQEEMKSAWDQELEDIASDHPTMLEPPAVGSSSFARPETPPPPTAPVKTKKKKDVKLVADELPPVVDHFTAGDELTDDWFGEDAVVSSNLPVALTQSDSDEGEPGNPMVLGDEDVEPIFYSKQPYQQQLQSEAAAEEEEDQSQPIHTEDDNDDQEVVSSRVATYQPPVFKSELDDVWSRGLRRLSGPEVVSDSDDEDNMMRHQSIDSPSFIPSPHASPYMEPPSFAFGSSSADGYEEIGGSNENPWSTGQQDYEKNEHETWTTEQDIQNQDDISPKNKEASKKKKSSKKKSSKKKKNT